MAMTKDEVEKKVIAMARNQFGFAPDATITGDTKYVEDFNADSLDAVECAMEFEDEFEIGIEDEEMEAVKTVSDAVNMIFSKLYP
jgi:acyl carrier protein